MNLGRKRAFGFSLIMLCLVVAFVAGSLVGFGSGSNRGSANTLQANNTPVPANGKVREYTFYVRTLDVVAPDGEKIWSFGFTDDPNGPAKIPAPLIVVDQGDTVKITLINDRDPTQTAVNTVGDGHTIHLHGLDLPFAMDGDPMTAPGGRPVMPGEMFVYSFVATHAGTYWYHCHQGAAEHIQMGMYGGLVVRPQGQPNRVYADTPTFDKEYTFVLAEMDTRLHLADYDALNKGGGEPNWTDYRPDYFFINGKAWPDTMMDPSTHIEGIVNQTVLVRIVNTGYVVHSMHSHGFHFQVVGTDGRKLDVPYYKDTLLVGPGERYDVLFTLDKVGRFMFHDHVENSNTNKGAYPGGMITMISVNNPDGSNPIPMEQMMQPPGS